MSHFTCLVVSDSPDDVAAQLQPFHEYECTGTEDEYVVDVDKTDEVLAQYEKPVDVVKLADGTFHGPYDHRFFRNSTPEESAKIGKIAGTGTSGSISFHSQDWGDGLGYRMKVHFVPEGSVRLELPAAEARAHGLGYLTAADCAKDYFGAFERDGRFYRKTNPNARWDWWVMGGRWTGKLRLKASAKGTSMPRSRHRWARDEKLAAPGYCDQARKGDIDWEQMRNDAGVKARHLWRNTRQITGGLSWETWDDTLLRYPDDIKRAREEYHSQPARELLKASGLDAYKWEIEDELTLDEEAYVELCRARATSQFAYVKDKTWTERGKMGWWAAVSDEMSEGQWLQHFNDMLNALNDDVWVTVVDCHI